MLSVSTGIPMERSIMPGQVARTQRAWFSMLCGRRALSAVMKNSARTISTCNCYSYVKLYLSSFHQAAVKAKKMCRTSHVCFLVQHLPRKWSLKRSPVSCFHNNCTFFCLQVCWLTLSIAEIHDSTLTGSESYLYRGQGRHQLTLGRLRNHILPIWHSKEPFSMLYFFFSSDFWSREEIKHPDWTAA